MAGENCTISVQTYGEKRVIVTRLAHGMELITSSGEDQSRAAKQFHTAKLAYGTFNIRMVFKTWEEREAFNLWVETYIRRLTNPGRQYLYPMRVMIPVRDFDRMGIPASPVRYGDEVARASWPVTMSFHAVMNPQKANFSELAAKFVMPTADDPALPYLYPAGEQLSGDEAGVDFTDFDETPTINEVEYMMNNPQEP